MLRALRNMWKAIPMLLTTTIELGQESNRFKEEVQTKISKIFLTTMQSEYDNLKLFSVNADVLGRQIAAHLDIRLGRMICSAFQDGEVKIEILDSIRGHRIYLLKTFDPKCPNDGLMQLLLAVSCARKQGAQSVTVILPYFPYTLPTVMSSEDVSEGCDYYTSFGSDIVKMLQEMGCDCIVSLNASMTSPKGFATHSSFLDLTASELVVPEIMRIQPQDLILVASRTDKIHFKNISKLKNTFEQFSYECGLGFFHKADYIGDAVKGRDILLFANVLRNSAKIIAQSQELKKQGAKNIYCFGFHGICKSDELEAIMREGALKQLILTNSVAYQEDKNIRTVSIAKLIAEVISILHEEKSLEQFRRDRELLNFFYLQKMRRMYSGKNVPVRRKDDKKEEKDAEKREEEEEEAAREG